MAEITDQDRAAFRERGYVVIPGVLDERQIAEGRRLAADLLAAKPPDPGHVGFHFLWPSFAGGSHALLDLYWQAGVDDLAGALLRPGLSLREPDSAQVAITIPPWPHRPGGPHVDGLTPPAPDGRPATFSVLAGIWLSDQRQQHQGNIWLWPGTHLRFGSWLAERGADSLLRLEQMNPGPYPAIDLGEPEQATGSAGSVILAHYLLGHNIGGHDGLAGSGPRQTIYYRLLATGHKQRWREAVTSPLLEFA
jgi:hypothetical protein